MSDVNDGGGNNAGGNESERPTWMASLPDAHKENERFSQFKEPTEAWDKFDSFLKAEGTTIARPGENATEEERTAFNDALYKELGRPETADLYDIKKPDGLPESLPFDEEALKFFKGEFHKLGLSKSQAEGIYKTYMDSLVAGVTKEGEAREAAKTEALNALKAEHGDNYPAAITLMDRAVEKFGGPEFKKYMDDSGLGNNPALIKTFINIGKAMSEDTLKGGDGPTGAGERKLGSNGQPVFEFPNSPDMAKT